MADERLDEVGYWSEIKLEIVRKYATAYCTVMTKQPGISRWIYIDGFAGAGIHLSRTTGQFIPGSPLNALNVKPPFHEFHLIDLDGKRAKQLRELGGGRKDIHVYEGDCNRILLERVFPRARYEDRRRALCLLDPYGLHLNWQVLAEAGRMRSIEVFLNFPVMDMNMNVLWRNPDQVKPRQAARMDAFWGSPTWRDAAYVEQGSLFGAVQEKTGIQKVAEAFRARLREAAGFAYVPDPMPMRNSRGAVVYYLFFASPNRTGAKIVTDICDRYRREGV